MTCYKDVHYIELNSNNTLMKMQVYQLLSALSMYSSEGYQVANTALLHYKVVTCNYLYISHVVNVL